MDVYSVAVINFYKPSSTFINLLRHPHSNWCPQKSNCFLNYQQELGSKILCTIVINKQNRFFGNTFTFAQYHRNNYHTLKNSNYSMRNLSTLLFLAALASSGCNVFKPASSSSSSPSASRKGDSTLAPAQYSVAGDRNLDYVSRFKDAAINEMESGGVPASIILAQGIIESAAGTSDLAQNANNHFGIKCAGWSGKTYFKTDDDKDKDGNSIESCFRKYGDVSESFHDHGEFLRDPKKYNRYGFLFNLDRTDYKSWARGLQSAGYATNPAYSSQLINLIERYRLFEYDRPGSTPTSTPNTPGGVPQPTGPGGAPVVNAPTNRIGRVNDVKVVLTREGESLDEIARAYRIGTTKVADYNDRGYSPGVKLKPGTRIYIQSKKD